MRFTPLVDAPRTQLYFGFDIETEVIDGVHHFLCCAITNDAFGYSKVLRSEVETIKEMRRLYRRHACIFVATNLEFDLTGLLKHSDAIRGLFILPRGSRWILAKLPYTTQTQRGKIITRFITFNDTLNFFPNGVAWLGEKFLHMPKLSTDIVGRRPQNAQQWMELTTYNRRDASITEQTMTRLQETFNHLDALLDIIQEHLSDATIERIKLFKGFRMRHTIASTAMDCYRRLFLGTEYDIPEGEALDAIYSAYYGGRCETFRRGRVRSDDTHKYVSYDINSMYPHVMRAYRYPDPNTLFTVEKMTEEMLSYEGVCYVDIEAPQSLWLPYLPMRSEHLMFCVGRFSGWYTTFEIREALRLGYNVHSFGKGFLHKATCDPFTEYVNTWYSLRMHWRAQCDAREHIAKLMLNSLYGRFAMRLGEERKIFHQDALNPAKIEFLEREGYTVYAPHQDSVFLYAERKDTTMISDTICPIFSVYVTAYARHELYQYLKAAQDTLVYTDTDSITCAQDLPTSSALGALKREKDIQEGIFIKAKMYAWQEGIHVKGLKVPAVEDTLSWMETFIDDKAAQTERWMRFGSVQRPFKGQKMDYQQIIPMRKEFILEDTKRHWERTFFDKDILETSRPFDAQELQSIKEVKMSLRPLSMAEQDEDVIDTQIFADDIEKEEAYQREFFS